MTELSPPMERALQLARDASPEWIPRYSPAREWNPAVATLRVLLDRGFIDIASRPHGGLYAMYRIREDADHA